MCLRGKVLQAYETGPNGMSLGGQIVQQTSEAHHLITAGLAAQWWIFFAQPTEPAEQMRIAAELREAPDLRKSSVEIGEEPVSTVAGRRVRARVWI